jgi:hypothetical protein
MSITISDTSSRVQYTASSSQTAFTVPFEFFNDDDLVVIHTNSGGVDSTLTKAASPSSVSQYSVSGAGESGGGNITLGSGATAGDKYTIFRNLPIARTTDFPTSGTFPIETLNTELDKIVALIQQAEVKINLSPKASSSTSTAFGLTFPELVANKLLTVNSAGNGLEFSQEIGTFKGNWSSSVAYVQRDIVKDTSTNNIFIALTSHTSSGSQPLTTNTDSAKWSLLVDASSATTSQNAAATSATASANSATASANSATASANSATASASSATSAANSFDSFDDRYLGAKSSEPSADNDGDALITGALFFDTTVNATKVYTGSAWQTVTVSASNQANINTVAGISSNVTTVAGIASNVTSVAGVSSDVTSVAGIASNVTAVASDATDIGNVAGSISNVNTVAGSISNVNTVAGSNSNIGTVAGSISNVNTVASNVSGVNSFADRYRVDSSDPSSSLDAGDLAFNTSSNTLKYYDGSAWQTITADTDVKTKVSVNDTTAGFLNGKLVAGTNVTFTENNDSGNETLTIAATDNSIPFAIALG